MIDLWKQIQENIISSQPSKKTVVSNSKRKNLLGIKTDIKMSFEPLTKS